MVLAFHRPNNNKLCMKKIDPQVETWQGRKKLGLTIFWWPDVETAENCLPRGSGQAESHGELSVFEFMAY